MKKAKRLLAVLLSVVMLLGAASFNVYGYVEQSDNWHVPKGTEDQKYYFTYEQGCGWVLDMLDGLLGDLGVMIDCDDLNEMADIGLNIFTSNALLNLDDYLEDRGVVNPDNDNEGAIDIRSVDLLIRSLSGIGDCVDSGALATIAKWLGLLGDLTNETYGLVPALTRIDYNIQRFNGVSTDRDVLEMLISFIADLGPMLQAILAGSFNWGSLLPGLLEGMLDSLPVPLTFVDNKLDINSFLNNLLYNMLIDSNATTAAGGTIDQWVAQLIDWMLVTGTGDGTNTDATKLSAWGTDGATSMVGPNAEPLFPALANQPGGASLGNEQISVDRNGDGTAETVNMSFYQLVSNVIAALFEGTLKDLLYDLLADMLEIEVTEELPYGDPAILQDQTFSMIVGIVEGLFVDNGAPVPTYTEEQNKYPVHKLNALLDWLLAGKYDDEGNQVAPPALDTFILIDYYGFHIQDNFMSLLNDVARLLINLLPSLGLFSDSAHLAYTPDQLTVSWYVDADYNLVSSLDESKVTPTYITFETEEVVYPTEYITDANGAEVPVAYCYLDDKSAVNITDSTNETTYRNPSLIRPNYTITTDMVFANIVKLAVNDMIDGCYFPEWTTDIPSVLAYAFAAFAAPTLPQNNYFARLDAYYYEELIRDASLTTGAEPLPYVSTKIINGVEVEIPYAALCIISSYGANRLNGEFHFENDSYKFNTDTTFERFASEFLIWAASTYLPAFVGEYDASTKSFLGTNTSALNSPIFASAMTTLVNANYSDFDSRTVLATPNWDAVYSFIDSSLFKLLPTSWLPNITGSSQLINETLLNNLINFDIQGILDLLTVNTATNAELNNSVTKVLVNIIDRVLALVFNDNGILTTGSSATYYTSSYKDCNGNNITFRSNVVMGNNVTSMSTLAEIVNCSSTSACLPVLISRLLALLDIYKKPLLGTILPMVIGTTYIRPHDPTNWKNAEANDSSTTDYKITYSKIIGLEGYLKMLNDNVNAYEYDTTKVYTDEGAANAVVDGRQAIVKNTSGTYDIQLSNGDVYGTYSTIADAKDVVEILNDSYVVAEPIEDPAENGPTHTYHIYARRSYLISATPTPKTLYDTDGETVLGEYEEFSDFRLAGFNTSAENSNNAALGYRPYVNYEKVDANGDPLYRYFEYEDFGTGGYLYNNQNDADDGGYAFVDEYKSFIRNDLSNAYGEWYMFYINSMLKHHDAFDSNGDGYSVQYTNDAEYVAPTTDANGNQTDDGNPVDGNPSIPGSMYPFMATASTDWTKTASDTSAFTTYDIRKGYSNATVSGWTDTETGQVISGIAPSYFNSSNFEQLALAIEYGADPEYNVALSDADAESVIRYALLTYDSNGAATNQAEALKFDITLQDGVYSTGSVQWEGLTEAQWTRVNSWISSNGFTLDIETAEDGTTTYTLKRPLFTTFFQADTLAFCSFTDGAESYTTNVPELKEKVILDYLRGDILGNTTHVNEIEMAVSQGYYDFIETIYRNREQLFDEIDEITWRREKAESGRKSTIDTTVLKYFLDLTKDDYQNPDTRKLNYAEIKDEETGRYVEVKQYTTSSYENFRRAYDFANSLYLKGNGNTNALESGVTQSMVTQAYSALLDAWMKLVEFTGFADWTQIDNLVAVAEAILDDPYATDPDNLEFGIAEGLDSLVSALKDAYVYTDNLDNPSTEYDLHPNSKSDFDSEMQTEIDSAAAYLNQAIQNLVYNSIPKIVDDPEETTEIQIQETKFDSQIQYAHIYGLKEGVGFGDNKMTVDQVIAALGLKVSGMTLDGENNIVERSNSTFGSGTDSRIDGRYRGNLRFRYFAVLYGDLNGDTRIDGTDATILAYNIALYGTDGITTSILGEAVFEAADVNHDGAVDDEDYQIIVDYYTLTGAISQDTHAPVSTVTVNFADSTGTIIKTYTVPVGSQVSSIPSAPALDGYTFTAWVDGNGNQLSNSTKITADVTYTAQYTANA